jgi:hypothetical protein
MTHRLLTLALPIAFLAAACSSGDGPSAPSSLPIGSPSAGGATITGSLMGAPTGGVSGMTSATTSATGPATSTTVSIVGTTVSVTVDASGKFTLTNVPGGTLQLQISGPGFSGVITVENVKAGETIELVLSVTGAAVTVASQRRSEGSEEQLEGRVESLPPTTAAGSLVVSGRTVTTNAETQYFMGSTPVTFADLAIGQRVHVKGQPDGTNLAARLIDIQNEKVGAPVNVNGIVANLSSTLPDFQFEVDGRLVMGDALTEFFGGSVFTDLVDGGRVEVKGEQRDGFVYAARIHVNRDDTNETEFTGIVSGLGGVCPAITFVVDGTQAVEANEFTEFKNTTCPSVINGATVEVSGTVQPGGSVLARKISIEDDANEAEFTGVIASTSPLVVGTTTVQTTAATEVRRRGDALPLDILRVGMNVEVSGTTQSDASVIAKKITIEDDTFDVDVEGALTGLTPGCPAIQFTIDGLAIVTSIRTEFKKTACSALTEGANVKVRGVLRPDNITVEATRVETKK